MLSLDVNLTAIESIELPVSDLKVNLFVPVLMDQVLGDAFSSLVPAPVAGMAGHASFLWLALPEDPAVMVHCSTIACLPTASYRLV
ncbi:hypothetical protein SynA15127_02039 [Synechococcus sp. A15-127]|uniref:hypothetical protein n=1 Tax=Synechococcus sp. A15-127 TaxID=1050624 RepID=UPI001648666D|nr:hypothetical protein [Synechococcus sp. A15-127]QNI95108.1 hypothetical protein SynA15127_02039 [Synechococcus sp. A15-127]